MTGSVVLFLIVLALVIALYLSWRFSADVLKGWKLSRTQLKAGDIKRKKANDNRTS